ncbi:hypothetical protein [Clostridium beijerinckii]|uniref:hypothetical protein n=1 Tax=Clostridium beijerinckii TaxID=1520 RepID=UPI00156E2A97|nr:hypothetical protein [Clostridium beijerinckii]NRU52567.1 hypothetical protein [Clostridium beijerinckii]NYC69256.1 hypothetical protein [Clostridium beijerinckii]NYC91768.1 hypothetical protein [Clostridium beijerinckii]
MNIKRYKKNIITRNIRKEKTITEQINQVGGVNMNARIQELQKKLSLNMNKAVLLAEKNTIRNEQGYVVLRKDDEWRDEDEWEE